MKKKGAVAKSARSAFIMKTQDPTPTPTGLPALQQSFLVLGSLHLGKIKNYNMMNLDELYRLLKERPTVASFFSFLVSLFLSLFLWVLFFFHLFAFSPKGARVWYCGISIPSIPTVKFLGCWASFVESSRMHACPPLCIW